MKVLNEIFPLLSEPKKIAITFHQKPDADAMGSGLGLYNFLIQFGHTVSVISPTNWPSFLNWMPGAKKVFDFELQKEETLNVLEKTDWLFCLDFNVLSRTKNMEPVIEGLNCTRILIDHHQQPQTEIFDYGWSDVNKSSTAEMIFDFIMASGNEEKINSEVAECLYAGVMTDTGSFRFNSASSDVHKMVAKLKERGLNHSQVHENLFDNFLETRYRFFGNTLLNRMELFYEYNTALIAIPQKDLIRFNVKTGDTEGLVNFPLSIKGIRLAAVIIDRGDERKSSFRSKGGFDVNSFARKYFNGGGHFNAAGGKNKEPLEEVIAKFKKAIKENQEQLTN
ncbi:bifunctional oligoribonuclease/PAP phosphatase NrnA [Hanamia caeni]|jgi:phosphoesterase RecJ-like protein|uniref:Bifunctional oligoribonuclease/PAP phosphatase NrnA n=1 Tax=Hanamia caeni TaxID=2294116 RepID=A0A3M9NBW2_9BACT|nr:bifunctional oligoribonuclease/PAP phosphatase NrnA [Hanamia caeni]RNI35290.1 bifunctional oligoribonuclease/PAP phosphatase NrnA [Hanamia caeni]